MMIVGDW